MIQLISPIDGSPLAPREGYLVDVSGHRFPVFLPDGKRFLMTTEPAPPTTIPITVLLNWQP